MLKFQIKYMYNIILKLSDEMYLFKSYISFIPIFENSECILALPSSFGINFIIGRKHFKIEYN